jgi:hypothetical protein
MYSHTLVLLTLEQQAFSSPQTQLARIKEKKATPCMLSSSMEIICIPCSLHLHAF